jgi:hypothetical protein
VKRLLVGLSVLALLLLAGDRIGVVLAERAVARELAASGLSGRTDRRHPRLCPFLTQAVRGRYDEVVVTAQDVPAGELRFSEFEATLTGLQVPVVAGGLGRRRATSRSTASTRGSSCPTTRWRAAPSSATCGSSRSATGSA